jgi:hypothetical protein
MHWGFLTGLISIHECVSDRRINISVANVIGMGEELVLTGNNHYNIALLVFFPGYYFIL